MANALSTGAWFFAPTQKPSFFSRLLRVQLEARQHRADREVAAYLAARDFKLTGDAEREIGQVLATGGRQP